MHLVRWISFRSACNAIYDDFAAILPVTGIEHGVPIGSHGDAGRFTAIVTAFLRRWQ